MNKQYSVKNMAFIKIKDIIRCSSEDISNPARNLLTNNGKKWLSSKLLKDDNIEVEFQLPKAVVISYIDIGNFGSHLVTVLVTHSMRPDDKHQCILPTVTMMSVPDSKQGINKTKVQMFKKDDFMTHIRDQSWDIIKVVCRQPYRKGSQFGLSFINFKITSSEVSSLQTQPSILHETVNQNTLTSIFAALQNPVRVPVNTLKFSTPNSKKRSKVQDCFIPQPEDTTKKHEAINNTETPKMSDSAKLQFKEEVECFLQDIQVDTVLKDQTLKCSELRRRLEDQRCSSLNKLQKMLFIEIITKKFNARKQKFQQLSIRDTSLQDINIEPEENCQNCQIRLPLSILSLHTTMCKSRNDKLKSHKRKSRNHLCFDDDGINPTLKKEPCTSPFVRTLKGSVAQLRCPMSDIWTRKSPLENRSKKLTSRITSRKDQDNNEDQSVFDTTPPSSNDSTKTKTFKFCKTPTNTKKIERLLASGSSSSLRKQLSSPHNNTKSTISVSSSAGSVFKVSQKSEIHSSLPESVNHTSLGFDWVANERVQLTIPIEEDEATTPKCSSNTLSGKERTMRPGFSSVRRRISNTRNYDKKNPFSEKLSKIQKLKHQIDPNTKNIFEDSQNIVNSQTQKARTNLKRTADFENANITHKTNKNCLEINTLQLTQECPICYEQIFKYEIGVHASICDGPAKKESHSENIYGDQDFDVQLSTSVVNVKSTEFVECPICLSFLEKELITAHVNHCLDSSM